MVPSRIELKKPVIEGVREPGQRMPVGYIVGSEGPCQRVPGPTRFHVEVIGHIFVVIVVDERMVIHRKIQCKGRPYEEKAEKKHQPPARGNLVRVETGATPLRNFLLVLRSRSGRSQSPS